MRAPPAIGALRQRAALEAPQDAPDGVGGFDRLYTRIALVHADIQTLTGAAQFIEQRAEQAITHIARIRWRKDVTGDMRFRIGERRLLIRAVFDEDQRKRFLTCHCQEIAP